MTGDDMEQSHIAAMMKGIAPVLRDIIARAVQPLASRLQALESREPERGEKGEKGDPGDAGRDVDPAQVATLVTEEVQKAVALIPAPQDGRDGADAYPGEAKGKWEPAAPTGTYRALDVVSWQGSEWRAKHDDPGPCPGDGWMLSASKGKRGEKGDKGDRGDKGTPGAPGASFAAGYIDTEKLQLVLTRDDGEEVTIDLQPFAELVRDAA